MNTATNEVNTRFNTTVSTGPDVQRLADAIDRIAKSSERMERRNQSLTRSVRRTQKEITLMSKAMTNLNRGVRAFITFELSRQFSAAIFAIGGVIAETQKLEASLLTITGSASTAGLAVRELQSISTELPVQSTQLINAFRQLELLNLDSSEESLRSLVDLSAGLGRNLPQLVEAIADASTFEFERLKEQFGIVARSVNDEIQVTFQGTTTTIEKSALALQDFINGIAQDFDGGAANQLDTIGGAWVRFTNSLGIGIVQLDEFFRVSEGIGAGLNATSNFINDLTDTESLETLKTQQKAADKALADSEEALRSLRAERQTGFITNKRYLEILRDINIEEFRRSRAISASAEIQRDINKVNEAARVSALETTVSEDLIRQNITGNNALFISADKLISKYEEERTELGRLEDSIADLTRFRLILSETPILRDQPETAAALKRLDEAFVRLSALRGEAADKDFQKSFDGLLPSVSTAVEGAVNAYQASLSRLDTISDDFLERAGFTRGDLARRLRDDFEKTLLDGIGEPVIRGITDQSIRAWEEQQSRLSAAVQAGLRAGVGGVRDRFNDIQDQQRDDALNAALAAAQGREDPLVQFEREFLQSRAEFVDEVLAGSAERQAAFAELTTLNNIDFLSGESVDFSNFDTFAEKIDLIREQAEKFRESAVGFTAENVAEFFNDRLLAELVGSAQSIADLERLLDNTSSPEARDDIQGAIVEATNERIFLSNQDLYNRLADLDDRYLDGYKLNRRQIASASLSAANDVLGIWAEQSDGILSIQKGLQIALIALDAEKALASLLEKSVSNPIEFFRAAISFAAVVAKFGKLIQSARNRERGDGRINSPGENRRSLARQAIPSSSSTGTNTINIYGNVLDNNGFRRLVVDSIREASGNDELTPEDFQERRF